MISPDGDQGFPGEFNIAVTYTLTDNNELKIEVEQLKGPGRIIRFAEKELGMSVARSNIYVKAGAVKNSNGPTVLARN